MSQSSDLDVLKDIPGYKAILKSVLKSQIQLLIEQLADHTGEESIILTASINDGTLSHLGSSTGKGFLEGRDDMKSQFLGYCLKTYHKKKTVETKSPANQRSNQRHMPYRTPPKRDRIHPVSLQRAQVVDDSGSGLVDPSEPLLETNQTGSEYVKIEGHEVDPSTSTFPSSLQLSHTQTSGDLEKTGQGNGESEGHIGESGAKESSNGASESSATDIKIEPITENEMELEITGVEPGNVSLGQDDWGQGQAAGYATPSDSDTTLNQSADASNYTKQAFAHRDMGKQASQNPLEPTYGKQKCQIDNSMAVRALIMKHACTFCGRPFQSRRDRERHERIHTGSKPFVCDICEKAFNQKSSLNSHRLRHFV